MDYVVEAPFARLVRMKPGEHQGVAITQDVWRQRDVESRRSRAPGIRSTARRTCDLECVDTPWVNGGAPTVVGLAQDFVGCWSLILSRDSRRPTVIRWAVLAGFDGNAEAPTRRRAQWRSMRMSGAWERIALSVEQATSPVLQEDCHELVQ